MEIIDHNTNHNFVDFRDIGSKFAKKEEFDIYGTLVKVEDSKVISTANGPKTVRDIVIINKEPPYMTISLWDDMAINEGEKLQKMLRQNPIIAISNVKAKDKFGELQVQSTIKSILQISPECPEIEHSVLSCYKIYDPLQIDESMMMQKATHAKEVTLRDLKENRHTLSKECYYCFVGIVDGIQNKASIWYDSCKKCTTSCPKFSEDIICRKCNEKVVKTIPRYRITMNVIQGVTMFNDAAAVYVGCPVDEYISSISQGGNESAYYRGLSLQNSKEARFVTTANSVKIDDRGNLTLIANAVQKMEAKREGGVKKGSKKKEKPKKNSKTIQMDEKEKINVRVERP